MRWGAMSQNPRVTLHKTDGIIFSLGTPTTLRQKTNAFIDHCTWRKAAILDRLARKSNIDDKNQGNYEKIQSMNTYIPYRLLNLFSWKITHYTVDTTVNKTKQSFVGKSFLKTLVKEYGDMIGQLLLP